MAGPQGELHDLIRNTLKTALPVTALVTDVFDSVPSETTRWGTKQAYISFGPTDVIEDDAECIVGGVFTVQLDCWSRKLGTYHCKSIVDAVKAALHDHDAQLASYGLVQMRVTMRRVFGDPDGLTMHGVVIVEAQIEEEVETA